MSDTPRTDAATFKSTRIGSALSEYVVCVDDAKRLERELAAARQREGEIRASVIEECARVCDKVGQRLSHGAGYACKTAAEEIRNSA